MCPLTIKHGFYQGKDVTTANEALPCLALQDNLLSKQEEAETLLRLHKSGFGFPEPCFKALC